MTDELFVKLISAAITIIVSLITAFLIPWIRSKITDTQLEQIDKYVEWAVRCAEQIYTTEEWQKKKEFVYEYVLDVVNEKYNRTLTPADIDIIIEGIVNQVKKG